MIDIDIDRGIMLDISNINWSIFNRDEVEILLLQDKIETFQTNYRKYRFDATLPFIKQDNVYKNFILHNEFQPIVETHYGTNLVCSRKCFNILILKGSEKNQDIKLDKVSGSVFNYDINITNVWFYEYFYIHKLDFDGIDMSILTMMTSPALIFWEDDIGVSYNQFDFISLFLIDKKK